MPPKIGLPILIVAVCFFGCVAQDVLTGGPLTIADLRLAEWFHAHSSPLVTRAMLAITHVHDPIPATIGVVLFSVYLALKRNWYWLACLGVTMPFGMLLNVTLANGFQRTRPLFDDPLLVLTTYSFPSGHVTGSTLFYGVLAAMLISRIHVWSWRAAFVMSAIMMVSLVALTRLYLGVHFLSDVLAGVAEGVAWLTLCLVGMYSFRAIRRS